MGILCVFCVYDTIGNRCFEKTSFPKIETLFQKIKDQKSYRLCSFNKQCRPYEMLRYVAFHLGLHCLKKYLFRGFPHLKCKNYK